MAPFLLLLNATKVIGAAGIIAVAVDSVAYRRYRKRNLTPFENPLDETEEILARFEIEEDGKLNLFIIMLLNCLLGFCVHSSYDVKYD